MAKTFSGSRIVKILCKHFGFFVVSQKGSHIKLQRTAVDGTFITIIPNHSEVQLGTLSGILKLAKVEKKDFMAVAK